MPKKQQAVTIHPYYFSTTKQVLDAVLSLLLFVVSLPIFLCIGIIIFITVGGPIFFTQQRMGRYKKPFTIFKFRTMHVSAEKVRHKLMELNETPAPMFKMEYDPRFVGIGRWLSKVGLDELPQLLNVLRNEMSLIGPRPLPVSEAQKLSSEWDFRYAVLPGIFSEWALSKDKFISQKKWISIEQKMLSVGSPLLDIQILYTIILKQVQLLIASFR